MGYFFSPSSVGESPLSLLLFRFTVISIGSVFSSRFSFDVADGDDCFVAVVAVETVVTVVESVVAVVEFVVLFSVGAIVVDDFLREFFSFSW